MRTPEAAVSLLPLMVWTSPAFPVGAYAYSHGLEWAVESGRVADASSLADWLRDLLRHGAPRNDAILAAAAHRAVAPRPRREGWGEGLGDLPGLSMQDDRAGDESAANPPAPHPDPLPASGEREVGEINALALALAGSRERHLETSAQGNAFVEAARASWPCAALDRLREENPGDIAYSVAFAAAAAGHGLPLIAALEGMLLAFVGNLVSAAQRLGCIGQTDGQRVIAQLTRHVRETAAQAAASTLDDLGGCALQSDLASLQHESQYSRLFRS